MSIELEWNLRNSNFDLNLLSFFFPLLLSNRLDVRKNLENRSVWHAAGQLHGTLPGVDVQDE